MSVRIRLRRVGRKKQPSYRLVVATSTAPRGGEYLETLGFYNPRTKPAELRVDMERIDHWLGEGAEMSDTAASLVKRARKGSDDEFAVTLQSDLAAQAAALPAAAARESKAARGVEAQEEALPVQAEASSPNVAPEVVSVPEEAQPEA